MIVEYLKYKMIFENINLFNQYAVEHYIPVEILDEIKAVVNYKQNLLLFNFLKYYVEDGIKIKGGNNYGDSLQMMIEYIKKNSQKLDSYLPKKIQDYDIFENLVDDITTAENLSNIKKTIDKFLTPTLRSQFNVKNLSKDDINTLTVFTEYVNDGVDLFPSTANYNNIQQFINDIKNVLNNINISDDEFKNKLISLHNGKDIQLIHNENNVLAFRVINPAFIKTYGSKKWCIVYAFGTHFKQYINPLEDKCFYMVFNFNYDKKDKNFMFGITIDEDGNTQDGGHQNNYNDTVELVDIIKINNLPNNIFKKYKYSKIVKKQFEEIYNLYENENITEDLFNKHIYILGDDINFLFENIQKDFIYNYFINNYNINTRDSNKNTLLIYSSEKNYLDVVEKILKIKNININLQNVNGNTALYVASAFINNEVFKLLLQSKDININIQNNKGETVLNSSSKLGDIKNVKLLLQHNDINVNIQDSDGYTALYVASSIINNEVFKLLLQHKDIDVNKQNNKGKTVLNTSSKLGGDIKNVKLLLQHNDINVNIQDSDGYTALYSATLNNNIDIVKILLQHKDIDVNIQDSVGKTVLYIASFKNYKEIVESLLQHKDINVNIQDKYGDTALFRGSLNKNIDIMKMLLQHKDIDVNLRNSNGRTILCVISDYNYSDVAKLLLQHKDIDVNIQDKNSRTALFIASIYDSDDVAELILQHKDVNVNIQDNNGKTVLYTASLNNNINIVKMLLKHKDINVNIQNNNGKTAYDVTTSEEIKQLISNHPTFKK